MICDDNRAAEFSLQILDLLASMKNMAPSDSLCSLFRGLAKIGNSTWLLRGEETRCIKRPFDVLKTSPSGTSRLANVSSTRVYFSPPLVSLYIYLHVRASFSYHFLFFPI